MSPSAALFAVLMGVVLIAFVLNWLAVRKFEREYLKGAVIKLASDIDADVKKLAK